MSIQSRSVYITLNFVRARLCILARDIYVGNYQAHFDTLADPRVFRKRDQGLSERHRGDVRERILEARLASISSIYAATYLVGREGFVAAPV